jgi:hypothetical protein
MRKVALATAVVALLLGVLAVTNPGEEEFAAMLRQRVETEHHGVVGKAVGRLEAAADRQRVEIDSYLFFSLAQVPSLGRDDLFLGVLGRWYALPTP